MKKKKISKISVTGSSQLGKTPKGDSETSKGVTVIPDECGDSLWDDVLAQEKVNELPDTDVIQKDLPAGK